MSERNTIWLLRALALALAILAWTFISLDRERESERPIVASVQYNIPDHLVVLDPVETVNIRLSGPESSFGGLDPFDVFVVVDLTDESEGPTEINLTPSEVRRPSNLNLRVTSIEPNALTLDLDRVSNELRPVEVRFGGEPAAGAVVGQPTIVPESVMVRGPSSILRQVEFVQTRALDLTGHAIDFSESVLLRSPDPLITVIEPSFVSVMVPLAIPNAPGTDDADSVAGDGSDPDDVAPLN
jgi:YbbR domain-containing protein